MVKTRGDSRFPRFSKGGVEDDITTKVFGGHLSGEFELADGGSEGILIERKPGMGVVEGKS